MEAISQILGASGIGFADSTADENKPKLMEEPEPIVCEFCGALRRRPKKMIGEYAFYPPIYEPCSCSEGKAAYEREQEEQRKRQEAEAREKEQARQMERIKLLIGQSGMGARFLRRTFETFTVDNTNRQAYTAARDFADNFDKMLPRKGTPEPGKNGLFICGDPGTGKTHLAAAIANQLLYKGRAVVCMTMIDLLKRIRRTFSPGGGEESAVLDIYKTVQLLIIDDMGKEPPTEWTVSTIYDIINGRYEAYLPTIVTTNYGTDAFIARMTPRETRDDTTARATIDRLREMCKGIAMTGESRRGK